jgi:hypothetical protein
MCFFRHVSRRISLVGFMALTTLAAFWFAGPVRAQVSVSAPTDAQARQLQSWYEHHIPARFRARTPFSVRELNDAQMDAYLKGDENGQDDNSSSHTADDDGDIDGVYESDPDRMALRLPAAGDIDMFTFAHEYGHYVWFDLLTDNDRRRYEALYKRQRAANHLVTRYAATDVEEGFAEAFSFYASAPPMLARRDPVSLDFLSQMANSGKFKPNAQ